MSFYVTHQMTPLHCKEERDKRVRKSLEIVGIDESVYEKSPFDLYAKIISKVVQHVKSPE